MNSQQVLAIVLFLAAQTVIFLTACVAFYTKVQVKLRELEIRINMVERQDTTINNKLDKIDSCIQKINNELQNKKNRDN